ncbi:MAG TPA: hypothetical protein VIL44_10745 [Micromonospora sp.]
MTQVQIRRMSAFSFPGYSFDPATGVATFDYALTGPTGELRFTETVTFPPARRAPSPAFYRVLELLHVVAGVSYYKISAPPRLVLPTPFPPAAIKLINAVYTKGLAEFAYRNQLPHVLELAATVPDGAPPPALEPVDVSGGRPLSAMGGGKDSIVTLEALRRAGFDPVPFAVNPNRIIDSVTAASGLPALAARRRLDPKVLELNEAGAYNGHVPVTAINSLIAVATAALHGLGPVVMSNERSASDPNLTWRGHEINHQWSKGIEAEGLLREALAAHAGLVEAYFSLLRPLSELHIAKLFAAITSYDAVVTSCNRAFTLRGAHDRWCGDCPKCRFVFLALAPFMTRDRIARIFGTDLLADPAQVPGYRELLGIEAHKPFECVGEVVESTVALDLLRGQEQWRDAPVVRALVEDLPPTAWETAAHAPVFTADGPHFIPPAYRAAIAALG